MARAMVLCAGFGERMRPLTDEIPKPLLPVGDRPALAHITRQLAAAGYSEAVANTHWLPGKFYDFSDRYGFALTLIHEPMIRGVAGGIAGARTHLEPPVVVWNGDILLERPPLERAVASVARTGDLCLAVAPSAGAGSVGLDAAGRVVRLRGERHGTEVRSGEYVGLVALGAAALAQLPERGCLIGDYCLPRLRRGQPIETCSVDGRWWDVGSFQGYADANEHWLQSHANLPDGSYVDASASVASSVTLHRSVVGPGARVEGAGALSRCVVWSDSHAVAPLERCVVTPRVVHSLVASSA